MNIITGFFTSKSFKRFLWYLVDGFIGALITYLAGISWAYAPLIIAILESITKYLNTKASKKVAK